MVVADTLKLPRALGVDTSLSGQGDGLAGDMSTGVAGIDSQAEDPPWLDQSLLFPTVAKEDFKAAVKDKPIKFTNPAARVSGKGTTRSQVVQYAKQFLGIMYQWGGNTPSGFDCSGFTKYVLKKFGINLPRVSFQQANYGRRVPLSAALPGDLIAWDNSSRNNGADHIALYLGNGRIMEFPRSGVRSRIRKLSPRERFWAVQMTYPGESRQGRAK
jgi:cell wall-associated NlpC family hydrolase